MKVREMPSTMRPREKALEFGLDYLTDTELIAIILRSGYQGKSVISLAEEVLNLYPLNKLNQVSIADLVAIKGIKSTKALELLVCFELSRRVNLSISKSSSVINNPSALLEFIKSKIGNLSNEQFIVFCLNTKNEIIDYRVLFIGTVDRTLVHPREVFNFAIKSNASSIICAHNHPSQNVQPSQADIKMTQVLQKAGVLIGIQLIDHVIVSNSQVYSILGKMQ